MPEDYVTDVPYMRAFTSDLSPVLLRLVAALNGLPGTSPTHFDYCELGSGHGDTLATLAAAHPDARFVGVDINAEHVAFARNFASRGGLTNIAYLERDFEALLGEAVGPFDFIAAHGVLSWVSPEKRRALVDLASAKLKPGGLLYVGYNALPGWAAVEPLRRLLVERGAAAGGSSIDRARAGVALAKRLSEAGAAYFAANPSAKEMLATMEQVGLTYVAHEYLNAHWCPLYFSQVAEEMAARELYFAGQLPLHLNYKDLAIAAPLAPLFAEVKDRVTFESLKGYANNEFFRRDIFVKGNVGRDEAGAAATLDATPFGALLGAAHLSRQVRLPHHTLQFQGPLFDVLLPVLAGAGARTASELAALPELAAFAPARIRDALVKLALAGQVSPMLRSTRSVPAPAGALQVPSAYNRMVLQERLSSEHPAILASTAAGTGVPLTMLEGVLLRLLTEVPVSEWAAWVAAFARKQPFRLRLADRAVEDDDERVRVLLEQVEPFRAARLPGLIELGIVAPA